jgi:formylglycine-generating enzyme required for sulfatase activity
MKLDHIGVGLTVFLVACQPNGGSKGEQGSASSKPDASASSKAKGDVTSKPKESEKKPAGDASASASASSGKPEPPPGMVYIEGATFDANDHDGKASSTTVKSFFIDRTMVTNDALLRCAAEKKCPAVDPLFQLSLKKAPPTELAVGIDYHQSSE